MFRPKYPDIKRPEYGICGIHVRILASVIVIPYIAFALLGIVAAVVMQSYLYIFSCVFGLVVFLNVLAADKFEKPYWYLICLVYSVLATVSGIFLVATFIYRLSDEENPLYAVVAVLYVCATIYCICLFNVVRRARNYMNKEVLTGNVKRNYDRDRNQAIENVLYI
uniref:MARVEL domain-containing protein n=1 Tax=Panagrellus redivivus TaxID=6233 RepID=A0A7E4W700_PANRE